MIDPLILIMAGSFLVGASGTWLWFAWRWSRGINWQRGKERLEKRYFKGLI